MDDKILNLIALKRLLVDEQKWRDSILSWDFGDELKREKCGWVGCAMGLGALAGLVTIDEFGNINNRFYEQLGIPSDDFDIVEKIFLIPDDYDGKTWEDIMPGHVANKITAFLLMKYGSKKYTELYNASDEVYNEALRKLSEKPLPNNKLEI